MNNLRFKRRAALAVSIVFTTLPFDVGCAQDQETGIPRDTLLAAARDMMQAARYCALITLDSSGHPRARTMDPFTPDADMVVWLGTSRGTRKVHEIRDDPRVTLYYAHPEGDGYVSIYGTAQLVDDPQEKARRWKDEWAQFYTDREATYLLIAVQPKRLEIINYSRDIDGESITWRPPGVEFRGGGSRIQDR